MRSSTSCRNGPQAPERDLGADLLVVEGGQDRDVVARPAAACADQGDQRGVHRGEVVQPAGGEELVVEPPKTAGALRRRR